MSEEPSGVRLDATLRDFSRGQKVFNRYTLIKTLGRGGMGIVWLAHDEVLDRDVALKFLPEIIVHDRAVLEDLKRETKRSLELTHKNIVRIHDFVHDIVSGCISMEYIEGDTLSNLRADKPAKIFEPDELKPWLKQLCDALDYAHNHARIIHRDLKPSNLMINRRGDVKVADFGIARSLSDSVSMLTHARGTSGTLVYMSPQQLDGERGTHLDDIYSLGATIYELLTSKPPFYSGNIDRQIREKIAPSMTQRRKDLEIEGNPIPKNWEETVAACLAKDPAKRPQSVAEVAGRLQSASPQAHAAEDVPGKRSKRKVFVVVAWAATAIVLLTIVLSVLLGRKKPSPQQAKQIEQAASTSSAAERDFTSAMEHISGMNKVSIDEAKAIALLARAAGQHLPDAEACLASWTKYGRHGVPKDSAKAEQLARQSLSDGLEAAANNGRATAQEALALLYHGALGVNEDAAKAMELHRKAAEQGSAEAQDNLGFAYLTGREVPKDLSKAAEWFQKAADQGYANAQNNLGWLYENGEGVVKDVGKAAELYHKAADQGYANAQKNLGGLYENGKGVAKDIDKAAEWYRRAADQGDPRAQASLGRLYENGKGVPRDLNKAIELYQKAVDQGNADAQTNLGYLYRTGQGVPKNLTRAAELYQKAADQGNAYGQRNLGWLYETGTGVAKDLSKAAQLYQKAADQGNPDAQTNLGSLYSTGRGVTKDVGKAAELYQKAATQGNPFAQTNLGVLYENGTGVPKDLNKAAELYQKAADNGNEQARENLRRLEQTKSIATSQTEPKSKARPLLRIWMKTLGDYLYETSGASKIPPLRSIDKGIVIFSIGLHGTDLQAPLRPFDVITQVDGISVTTSTEFWNAIDKKSAGEDAELLVWRTDHMMKVTVRPEDLVLAKSRGALQRGESQLATRLLEEAAGQGHPEAQAALGDLYSEGKLIRPDYAKAAEFYQKAAEHNDPVGQYSLGVLYEQGKGVPQSLTTAIDLYKKAAQQGDAEAKKRLERIAAENQSTPTPSPNSELDKAVTDYNSAIEYLEGMNKVHIDYAKERELLERAAAQHLPEAEVRLAFLVKQHDETKAEQLVKQSLSDGLVTRASNGFPTAQEELALLYRTGFGITSDLNKAVELYRKASDQGNAVAQNNLGEMYLHGTGVAKDLSNALKLYHNAADQGSANAQIQLGLLYKSGTAVPKDLSKAADFFREASAQGLEGPAQFFLRSLEQATPAPATTPALNLTESPESIVDKFVKSLDANNAEVQLQFYSDEGGYYYEMGRVTKDIIRKDLEHDIRTWPSRVYSIHDKPKITPLLSGAFQAEFPMTYTLRNSKGSSSGILQMIIRFQPEGQRWKVFEIEKKPVVTTKRK